MLNEILIEALNESGSLNWLGLMTVKQMFRHSSSSHIVSESSVDLHTTVW